MSKEIILVRHGKAVSPDTFTRDIDRVLAERGINDGYKVGEKLKSEGIKPDLILTSPAARASHTALILSRALNSGTAKIKVIKNFYHCSDDTFLDEIYLLDNKINTVIISAHNPGITDLASLLTSGLTNFLPTTGTALIRFKISSWEELHSAKAESSLIIKPREL